MQEADDFLSGLWYLAAPSGDIARGKLLRKILFGEPVVFGRTRGGEVFALRDVCPHRGAPLSAGRLEGEGEMASVACPYHGWRFRARDGRCAEIPALADGGEDVSKIAVKRHSVHEENGLVWIYRPAGREAPPPAPALGLDAAMRPRVVARAGAEGPFDEAAVGLVDPAHTPFVHRQWWWREGAGLMEKRKTFEPTALGFKMPAHAPSSNSRIYRLLGGAPTTEIEFSLPALRVETVRRGARRIVGVTAITPTEPARADITHILFWDMAALTLLQPAIARMARNFLAQDGAILTAQNLNLSRAPHRPLYVGDPDEPAKWYYRLKRAWAEKGEGAPFVNPVEGGALRWRT